MIDIRPVGYILGWLVLLLGALMLPPLLLDLLDGDHNAQAFALASVLTMVENPGNLLRAAGGEVIARVGGDPPLTLELLTTYPDDRRPPRARPHHLSLPSNFAGNRLPQRLANARETLGWARPW